MLTGSKYKIELKSWEKREKDKNAATQVAWSNKYVSNYKNPFVHRGVKIYTDLKFLRGALM